MRLSRELPAAEIALLGLLEVLFGVTWAWLGAGEPAATTLTGGALVIGALLANELVGLKRYPAAADLIAKAPEYFPARLARGRHRTARLEIASSASAAEELAPPISFGHNAKNT